MPFTDFNYCESVPGETWWMSADGKTGVVHNGHARPEPYLARISERGNVRNCGFDQSHQSFLWEKPMNLRVIFAACIIAAFGSPLMTFDALGQKQSLKEKLVG